MWRRVFSLEFRILRRDRSAIAVLLLFGAFVVLAALAGGRQADATQQGLDRAIETEEQRIESHKVEIKKRNTARDILGSNDPRDPVWMGQEGAAHVAALPAAPLAAIAVGQRDLHPQAVRVTTEDQIRSERETESAMAGPTRLMTGAFDLAFLFVVLFPLVIIALSYELLSGERERGTLAMLLSQPVGQGDLVLGKAAARAVSLCAATLVFALLGLLVAGTSLGSLLAWLHVGLFAIVLVSWSLFWFSASIFVNSLGETSARNALQLVGVWLVLVIVIPGLVHVTVDAVAPPPSKIELLHEAREAAQSVEGKLTGLQGRHDVDESAKDFKQKVVAVQEELARRSEPVLEEMRIQVERRQALVANLRFTSPALIVQLALEDVAGSGATRQQRFARQVDGVHDRYQRFFFDLVSSGKEITVSDVEQRPTLVFEEEPGGGLAGRVLLGSVLLLALAFALVFFSLPRLRRIGRLTR